MQTHRVVHDLAELNYDDLEETPDNRNRKASVRTKAYQFIFAAIALGLFVGYLAKRE
jgi:hypothetical protein